MDEAISKRIGIALSMNIYFELGKIIICKEGGVNDEGQVQCI